MMKFYSKRGNRIVIDSSKVINEIFFDISKANFEEIESVFLFIMSEDKVLSSFSDEEILELDIDIVPNAKRKRMRYNFENFKDMFSYMKKENYYSPIIPYVGEDIK